MRETHNIGTAWLVLDRPHFKRSYGGIRIADYPTDDAARAEAAALAGAMSRKLAFGKLESGGAKVAMRTPPDRRAAMIALGDFIQSLGGRYIGGPDMGYTDADAAILRSRSKFVVDERKCGGPYAALGLLAVLRAAIGDFRGKRFAIQGLGSVGGRVRDQLRAAGGVVLGADIDPAKGGDVSPDDILFADVDVLCPCAGGGILTPEVVPKIRAKVVAGTANLQLSDDGVARLLHARGILYVPDFVASAGAVLHGALLTETGCGERAIGLLEARTRELLAAGGVPLETALRWTE